MSRLDDIKPVAWCYKDFGTKWQICVDGSQMGHDIIKPLYTRDQLFQKVKFTQAEFDEFIFLWAKYNYLSVYGILDIIFKSIEDHRNLYNKLILSNASESEFIQLWYNYGPENPFEFIEITKDKKWFVRRKDTSDNLGESFFYEDNGYFGYNSKRYEATSFDTEEEAMAWINPLTEAALLHVEVE